MSLVASVAWFNQPAFAQHPTIGTELFSRISSIAASIFNFISSFFSSLFTQTTDTSDAYLDRIRLLSNSENGPTAPAEIAKASTISPLLRKAIAPRDQALLKKKV
jgi:hypothetical protein